MSLTYTSSEALHKAQASRRKAALSTLGVTMLACAAVLIGLGFVVITALQDDPPVITPIAPPVQEANVVEQELVTELQPDPPDSSSSAPAPTIMRLDTMANISIAESEMAPTEIGFSSSEGIGSLGIGTLGLGSGNGKGMAQFFGGNPVSGDRFAFVVDFSGSNSNAQKQAVQTELIKVLRDSGEMQYQIIGFAGPAWFLGDEIVYDGPGSPIIVNSGRGREYSFQWDHVEKFVWTSSSSNLNDGVPTGNWLSASDTRASIRVLEGILEKKNWIGGTDWGIALETALQMTPQPDVIYFLTDGSHNAGNSLSAAEVAEKYGEQIRRSNIDLISIGLVSNDAVKALEEITARARGKLYRAQANGTGELIEDYSRWSTLDIEELGKKGNRKRNKDKDKK